MKLSEIAALLRDTAQGVLLNAPSVKAHDKADGSWLTELDLALQKALTAALMDYAPGVKVLGEEASADEQQALLRQADSLWVLDPLDGTSNLVTGLPFYGVSLARVEAGSITHGWVYDPNRDELFMAQAGQGAWLNHRPLARPTAPMRLDDCIAMIDVKRLPKPLGCALVKAHPFHSMRSLGSVALEWCWLAAGRAQLYLHGGQRLWDYAAGRLVLSELGGAFTMRQNTPAPAASGLTLEPQMAIAATDRALFARWRDWLDAAV